MVRKQFIYQSASLALLALFLISACGGGNSDNDASSSGPSVVGTWLWTETYDEATGVWSAASVTGGSDDALTYLFTTDRLTFSLTSPEISCQFSGPYSIDSNNVMIWTLDSSTCPTFITGDVYGAELEFEDDNTLLMKDDEETIKLIRQ